MNTNKWIFISPHLDDVALSCGGLVWDLAYSGRQVEVWAFFAGLPVDEEFSLLAQVIHQDWGLAGEAAFRARREEDHAACAVMGAELRHFDWLDAIYRRDTQTSEPIVNDLEALFGCPPETTLVEEIGAVLREEVPEGSQLVFPIGLGGHIDHQAVVRAGERVGRDAYYYADYPYILENFDCLDFQPNQWRNIAHPLGQDALDAWQDSVVCYTSQLSTFWRDEAETRLALRNYLAGGGGRLWKKSNTILTEHPLTGKILSP
jgi:LmbE family N-acetylglucosaminyl deacetylase